MIKAFCSSPVALAIFTACCWSVVSLIARPVIRAGVSAPWFAFCYGAGIVVVATIAGIQTDMGEPQSPLLRGMAGLAGLIGGAAMLSYSRATSLPAGYASVVPAITAAYPLLTALGGLVLFREGKEIVVSRMLMGTVAIVIGVYLVGTCTKSTVGSTKEVIVHGNTSVADTLD